MAGLVIAAVPLAGGCASDDDRSAATPEPPATTYEYAAGLSIDIAYPDAGDRPYPVAILVHGGELTTGDRREPHLATVAAGLRDHGVATASIDYTLGSEIPALLRDYAERTGTPYECDPQAVPTGTEAADDIGGPGRPCLVYERSIDRAVNDLEAATESIRARARSLSIDATRLAVYGESAGSTIALQFALTTARSHGIVAAAGAASGFRIPAHPDLDLPVLLATYADDLPNPSIAHANPPNQARSMRLGADQLAALGAPVELVTFAGAGHLPERGQPDFDTLIARVSTLFARAGVGPGG